MSSLKLDIYKKARSEPFKRWLAKKGYECMPEIGDPVLAPERSGVQLDFVTDELFSWRTG